MNIFRFRIFFDDQEDFIRELDIKSNQTFKHLHTFIVKSLNLDSRELASFHISDDFGRKLQEITLIDMSDGDNENKSEETPKIYMMENTKLETFLDEVNQILIYEYDFLQLHTFMLELIEIKKPDKALKYPTMTFSEGELSLRQKLSVESDPEKLQEELLKEFNMMGDDTDESDDTDLDNDDY